MEWRDVVGFEGLYLVNRKGVVKSLLKIRNASRKIQIKNGHDLALLKNKSGYYKVTLSKNGRSYSRSVHRLVAEAFIENPENKPMINHKNSKRGDNRVKNLEWCDAARNVEHAIKANRMKSRKVKNRCTGESFLSLAQFTRHQDVPYKKGRQEIVRLNSDCPCWKIAA